MSKSVSRIHNPISVGRKFFSSKKLQLTRKRNFHRKGHRAISRWLFLCSGAVFAMVVIGGYTRLTRSGLSMTSWSFLGERFPTSQQMWEEEFERYKDFPEYKRLTSEMTLSEFKRIYLTEYAHRMWGRALGILFLVPFAYFSYRGYVSRPLFKKLSAILAIGGAQGLVGWWMVKSGLEEKSSTYLDLPRVSPYRLATHLISALLIYLMLLKSALTSNDNYMILSKKFSSFKKTPKAFRVIALLATSVLFLTTCSGAFVAGNEAGTIYNTFPWMGEKGRLVPSDYINENIKPKWLNFFENQSNVQFNHRNLGYLAMASSSCLFLSSLYLPLSPRIRMLSLAVFAASLVQASLGISTLVRGVPVALASSHQTGAMSVLTLSFILLHLISRKRYVKSKRMIKFLKGHK